MFEAFKTFYESQGLFPAGGRALLAVSGGLDSVAMAFLAREAGLDFAVAHCNFGLRGGESDADEAFVAKLASAWGVPFHCALLGAGSEAQKRGISIQMAARDLRYAWFGELVRHHGYACVALAHHLGDSLETVLFNLAKGTGLAGLHGIRPKNGLFVRPMLFAAKAEILGFARSAGLGWREDSSNASNKYARNLIRQQVVPALKKINPGLDSTFALTLERLAGAGAVFGSAVAAFEAATCSWQGPVFLLATRPLQQLPPEQAAVMLHALLTRFGFNYRQAKDILAALDSPPGQQFFSASHVAHKGRGELAVCPLGSLPEGPWEIRETPGPVQCGPLALALAFCAVGGYAIPKEKSRAAFDAAKLRFPLLLRKWRPGDRFVPFGMKQSKKISDFLIDTKVPNHLKDAVYVLESGGEIAWLVGHRPSGSFAVGQSTGQVVEIEVLENTQTQAFPPSLS